VIPTPDETWPQEPLAGAPYAGDEVLAVPAPADPHRAKLVRLHLEVMRGERDPSDPLLRAAAAAGGLIEPAPPDERLLVQPLPVAPVPLCDAWLADIIEDVLPDVGLSSAERVLGPLADESPGRRARRVAAGVMAFSPYIAPRVRPVDRWYKDRRGGTHDERSAVRAVDRVPAMLWAVERPGEPRALLPVVPGRLPDGPVRLLGDRNPGLGAALPPGTWLARIFRSSDGWAAALALPLALRPDPAWLLARLELELWQLRCFVPEADWPLLLRERAEVLYRCCHEWAWTAREVAS
jgi:hypothetical protein